MTMYLVGHVQCCEQEMGQRRREVKYVEMCANWFAGCYKPTFKAINICQNWWPFPVLKFKARALYEGSVNILAPPKVHTQWQWVTSQKQGVACVQNVDVIQKIWIFLRDKKRMYWLSSVNARNVFLTGNFWLWKQ